MCVCVCPINDWKHPTCYLSLPESKVVVEHDSITALGAKSESFFQHIGLEKRYTVKCRAKNVVAFLQKPSIL